MANCFKNLGYNTLIPSKNWKPLHYPNPPIKSFVWNESWDEKSCEEKKMNAKPISKEDFFDIKPEIIFITAYENQFEILNIKLYFYFKF